MRLRRRQQPVKLFRGRPARESVLTVDVGGLVAVTAPWVPAEPCMGCGLPTAMRWHEYGTRRLHAVHPECLRVIRRELMPA
jgi:hypothetical protein